MQAKKQYKIGFIILQYGRPDLTIDCVNSIQDNVLDASKLIVVVDNNSPDDSAAVVQQQFAGQEDIIILSTGENLGFARGNNVGYTYARDKCEFMCILNSDVVLTQKEFWQILKASYEENQFAIGGPYIYLPNMNQPEILMPEIQSLEIEKKKLKKKKLYARLAHMGLNPLREKLSSLKSSCKEVVIDTEVLHIPHENIVLNGCCLFYTPIYIERFEEAFDPRTFFYGEENLLYLKVRAAGMKTLYEPKLSVQHLKFASTQSSMGSRKKTCFQWDNTVRAQELLIEEIGCISEKIVR